ncbi:MAG: NAD-dependent malic enzyme [Dehalococcoidia bacterium]|nr:NAD-dependent malic enzyme [Dehalococcoidia bacterium]MDW8119215.1 malic enzyme-like NAD(P)-binding protein [Chloroflexota bacterium]
MTTPPRYPEITYSITVRAEYPNRPGMLGTIGVQVGAVGGDMGAVDLVYSSRDIIVRDFTINARDTAHAQEIVKAIKGVPGVKVLQVSDPVFLAHLGGKIAVASKVPVQTRTDLAKVYTPGVARVSLAIRDDPKAVWTLTSKANTVAIVTDGSRVLGLGDVGPAAALPVMEGKALLFKELGGVDAWPLCLQAREVEEVVRIVKAISTGFGGINLEDIATPRCFDIEDRLKEELDIPVIHDDQHATAVAILAGLLNALRLVQKSLDTARIVVCGVGAAGSACIRLLVQAGAKNIIPYDKEGILHKGMLTPDTHRVRRWVIEHTNPDNLQGDLMRAVEGADVFIGLSAPGVLTSGHLKRMAPKPIVFALANPVPEIFPEEASPYAAIIATGRSDYPNQINNALVFPGMFRGVLDVRARQITDEMKLAAAEALASVIPPRELNPEYIIPSVFNKQVVRAVAKAVGQAAYRSGVAQRSRRRYHFTRL